MLFPYYYFESGNGIRFRTALGKYLRVERLAAKLCRRLWHRPVDRQRFAAQTRRAPTRAFGRSYRAAWIFSRARHARRSGRAVYPGQSVHRRFRHSFLGFYLGQCGRAGARDLGFDFVCGADRKRAAPAGASQFGPARICSGRRAVDDFPLRQTIRRSR